MVKVWRAFCSKPLYCKKAGGFRIDDEYLIRLSKNGKSIVAKTDKGNWVVLERLDNTKTTYKTLKHFDIYDHFFADNFRKIQS